MARAAAKRTKDAVLPAGDIASDDASPGKRNQPKSNADTPNELASVDQLPPPDAVVFDQPTAVTAPDGMVAPSNDPVRANSDAAPSDAPMGIEARPAPTDGGEPSRTARSRTSSRKAPDGSRAAASPPARRPRSRAGTDAALISDLPSSPREMAAIDSAASTPQAQETPPRKTAAVRKAPAVHKEEKVAEAPRAGATPKRQAAKAVPNAAPRDAGKAAATGGRKTAATASPKAASEGTAGTKPARARSARIKPAPKAPRRLEATEAKASTAKTDGSKAAVSRTSPSKTPGSVSPQSVSAPTTKDRSRKAAASSPTARGPHKGRPATTSGSAATREKAEPTTQAEASRRSAPKASARVQAGSGRAAAKPNVPARVAPPTRPAVAPGRAAMSAGRGAARSAPPRAITKASKVATRRTTAGPSKASAPRVAAPDPKIEASELQLGYLSGYVGFHLRLAQDASYRAFARHSDRETVKPGRFPALAIISLNPGISQSALGRAIARDKSTVSPLIKDLQSNGFISRKPSPYDRRSVTLSLTKKGERILEKLQLRAKEHEDEILTLIGSSKDRLMALLNKIIGGMNT